MNLKTQTGHAFAWHELSSDAPGEMLFVPGWGLKEWATLLSFTQPVMLEPSEVLIQARGSDRALYLVDSGHLEVATVDGFGGITLVADIEAGSVVGELAFFDGEPRSAKVWAVAPTRLLKLPIGDYTQYASQHPIEVAALLFGMARLLAYRVRNSNVRR